MAHSVWAYIYMLCIYTSWMLRIDGEWKRQGLLHLCVAREQSRGQNASSDTYRKIVPNVRLGGLATLDNNYTSVIFLLL